VVVFMNTSTRGPAVSRSVAAFLRRQRVGHLATADLRARPAVVPFCFVFDGRVLFSAIDEKPKRAPVGRLRRVVNVRSNPEVAVVVDHYDEDWNTLRFVLIRGRATLLGPGPEHRRAVRLLRRKYAQYAAMRLEERPVMKIVPTRIRNWEAGSASSRETTQERAESHLSKKGRMPA